MARVCCSISPPTHASISGSWYASWPPNSGRGSRCGRLTFEPVSIKMAKQQDLSLNPSKLSGLCGRLKCCLRYELPNAKGQVHGGCGSEGGCDNPSGCGSGGCGTGGCGSDSCSSG